MPFFPAKNSWAGWKRKEKKQKKSRSKIRLQLMEERSNLQKKQSTWAESLTRMQEDLKSQGRGVAAADGEIPGA